ncbi:PREDICTED: transglycosylase [Prunus dulcis]|uniref:PREDICTED: transglycosylase n=1 Tax=Prunus dulcis TaxID=3755 RepID=A0A5E4FGD5_PRUDU|nr:uncharacterized protein LOC117624176 [Prunus dulcis]XP_034211209.1 uncharacterized protein LOC117624176 [Prunus dulcis]VVA26986.1 PREDICTED: transglycosylase [Prunus dulcis]
MAVSFRYWEDCVDSHDLEEMWSSPCVTAEWLDAGESRGQKVHLSRDPDGQPFLTQTEMKIVAEITIRRHFANQIDPDMIRAIADLESDRQPLATRYDKKTKSTTAGIMQLLPKTADWLASDMGYQAYAVQGNPDLLFKPFVNVYFGAAYLKWLSSYDQKERSEEYVVRAYKGGTKKATHKSTLKYWQRYLSVKESLPSRKSFEGRPSPNEVSTSAAPHAHAPPHAPPHAHAAPPAPHNAGHHIYWDSRASPEDMAEMWNHQDVAREWTTTGEKRGKVRFSLDDKKRPYLSRVELKAVADIVLTKHFNTKPIKASVLGALAEVISLRFLNGVGPRTGIMGIDYSTALWLFTEMGFKAYTIHSADDLSMPFVSMYFGAAYLVWLVEYEGRSRTPEFVVQAYILGPKNVNLQDSGPQWLKFEEALGKYEDTKKLKDQGSCTIM